MRSKAYESYITSFDWWLKKKSAIERAGHHCQRCGSMRNLEVHHLTYDRLGEELDDDLLVVCHDCHKIEDERRRADRADRQWSARLDGWATKRYGENWEIFQDAWRVEEEFSDWLENRDE